MQLSKNKIKIKNKQDLNAAYKLGKIHPHTKKLKICQSENEIIFYK